MNPILIILVVVALVGLLVYRRKRGASASAAGTAAPTPFVETAPAPPAPVHSAPAPLARPAAVIEDVSAPPASRPAPPPPSNWIPDETIVEPGWPLPGEISGAWSPVTTDSGASAAVRDEPVAAISPVPPQPEQAPVVEQAAPPRADEWLMPESAPVEWTPGAEDIAPIREVFPVAEPQEVDVAPEPEPEHEFAAPGYAVSETAVTAWDSTGAVAEVEPPAEEVAPSAELPLWTPVASTEPEPVMWTLDAPVVEEEPEPEPEPSRSRSRSRSPSRRSTPGSLPRARPRWRWTPLRRPSRSRSSEPSRRGTSPPSRSSPPSPPRWPPNRFNPRDLGRAVADLAPLLDGLLPLTRVSDRAGVTPRLLALMRTLAATPLSVTEQATTLGVSRPVVADLTARLESLGLARRERCTVDGRRVRVVLTDRGRRICEEAPIAPEPEAIAERLARMDPGERDDVVRGLRVLERVAV